MVPSAYTPNGTFGWREIRVSARTCESKTYGAPGQSHLSVLHHRPVAH